MHRCATNRSMSSQARAIFFLREETGVHLLCLTCHCTVFYERERKPNCHRRCIDCVTNREYTTSRGSICFVRGIVSNWIGRTNGQHRQPVECCSPLGIDSESCSICISSVYWNLGWDYISEQNFNDFSQYISGRYLQFVYFNNQNRLTCRIHNTPLSRWFIPHQILKYLTMFNITKKELFQFRKRLEE